VQSDIFKPDELIAKVNAAIKEGYVPCGGLVQLDNPYHTGAQIAQALFLPTTQHNEESK
jgi:hypothetical protein